MQKCFKKYSFKICIVLMASHCVRIWNIFHCKGPCLRHTWHVLVLQQLHLAHLRQRALSIPRYWIQMLGPPKPYLESCPNWPGLLMHQACGYMVRQTYFSDYVPKQQHKIQHLQRWNHSEDQRKTRVIHGGFCGLVLSWSHLPIDWLLAHRFWEGWW